ncbi:plastocyanin/azurin family copper-binding protein [uncultured Nonlabens sp.]|uniref:plastocyanin/azurin family copper-binding protein n=1 Tax=uncultured Nonlabens sp. TaxID=859306 RepID=UPI00262BDD9C|nr:plastocyanin/azurin family copper-binding protein [uncultured Nonlabens sp.]
MKKLIALVVIALGMGMTTQAQDKMMDKTVKTIALEQVTGEFVQKQITVDAGTYVFDIKNNNVGHNVGFVLVKKGEDISNPKNHIKTAYVTEQVANNGTQHSNATKLEKGEYVYFCPLNPTSTDNLLIVK